MNRMSAVTLVISPQQWRIVLHLAASRGGRVAAKTLASAAGATGADLLALRTAGHLYAVHGYFDLASSDAVLDLADDVVVGFTRPGQRMVERVSAQNVALLYLTQRLNKRAPLDKVLRYSHANDEELAELDRCGLLDVYVGDGQVRELASIGNAERHTTVLHVTARGRAYATRTR